MRNNATSSSTKRKTLREIYNDSPSKLRKKTPKAPVTTLNVHEITDLNAALKTKLVQKSGARVGAPVRDFTHLDLIKSDLGVLKKDEEDNYSMPTFREENPPASFR